MPAPHRSSRFALVKSLLPVAALLFAFIAGVFAWQQRQRANELTKQFDSLTHALREKNDTFQERAALIKSLEDQNDAYLKESALLREKKPEAVASSKENVAPSPDLSEKNKVEFASKSYADPRANEVARQKQAAQLKQIYGDFLKESGLTPHQAEQFLNLQLDDAMQQSEEFDKFFGGEDDGTAPADGVARWQKRREELDRQLKALLGEAGFAKYEEYEKTTRERGNLVLMREQLGLNSTPLREDQANTLLRILQEERDRTPPTAFNPNGPEDPRTKYRAAIEGDNAEQFYKVQMDMNQRVLSRTGTVLSPDQYEALDAFQRQYLMVNMAGIEMAREILTPKKK